MIQLHGKASCQRSTCSYGIKVLLKPVSLKLLSTTHVFVINSVQAQSWHAMQILRGIGRFNIFLIFKVRIDFCTINIDFGDSVPVRKTQDYYWDTQNFWASFHANKPLQKVFKRVSTAYTYYLFTFYDISIIMLLTNNLTIICREITKILLIFWMA